MTCLSALMSLVAGELKGIELELDHLAAHTTFPN